MHTSRQWITHEFQLKPPHIAWMLDIFGHSAGHARLLVEMGIDTMVFARMPYYLQKDWE